jgi:hypothetical protein
MKARKLSARERVARGMEQLGFMDGPFVRYFLRGDALEVWRRDCRCSSDCGCWEFDKHITATDAHREAFRIAQTPPPPKAVPAPAHETDAIRAATEHAQAEAGRRWRPIFQEDAR